LPERWQQILRMKSQLTLADITRKNVEMIAKIEAAATMNRTVGQRLVDRFAALIGSWTFIVAQIIAFSCWIALNVAAWCRHWDPYPFILLDVVLTFQAALAMPVLMMSQNRQARLSEQRNHLDLQINLLAEQENTETLILLRKLCDKWGVELDDNSPVETLANVTDPNALVEQIQNTQRTNRPPEAP
jgi:uncharacterized membrane protein